MGAVVRSPKQRQITVAPSALPLSRLCDTTLARFVGIRGVAEHDRFKLANRVNGELSHAKSSGVMKIGYIEVYFASTTADSNLKALRGVGFQHKCKIPDFYDIPLLNVQWVRRTGISLSQKSVTLKIFSFWTYR